MNKANNGVVYTQEWVVEFMLDCCGYDSELDLTSRRIVEPSCGRGAFLIPIVKRLLTSMEIHGKSPELLKHSLLAFEVDRPNLEHCRQELHGILLEAGIDEILAEEILSHWLTEADYLTNCPLDTADYIVGNPPYIRATEIDQERREAYVKTCKTMTPGTDIYIGFLETALRSLSVGGVMSFICADRWMHNAYGKKLRRMVADHYSVELVLKMHDVDAFASKVSAYPAITQIRNAEQSKAVLAVMNEGFSATSVPAFLSWLFDKNSASLKRKDCQANKLSHWFSFDTSWPLTTPERLSFLNQLEGEFAPLQCDTTGTKVGIGVATGRDDVFIIDDPNTIEKELLIPLVTSQQTKEGRLVPKDVWLLNPWNDDGSLIDLKHYPKAGKYLADKEDLLRSRHVAKKSDERHWYRTIDKVHPELTTKPKLLLQDMVSSIHPVYDSGSYYPHHNLYWITSEKWDLEVLGGLLLSKFAEIIVDAYGVKMRGGTYRLQAQYLRKIRLPDPDTLDDITSTKLKTAFKTSNRDLANEASLAAFGLERIPV